jgi:hypothetical protein
MAQCPPAFKITRTNFLEDTPVLNQRFLSIEEIETVALGFKEDLQREANQAVRRKNPDQALAALEAIEYVDKFVRTLAMRSVSQIGRPARARPINILGKKA